MGAPATVATKAARRLENFATGFADQEKIFDVLKTLDGNFLSQLVEDQKAERLHTKIQSAS